MKQQPDIIMYSDGGARGNPGPAGAGAYITDAKGTMLAEVSSYLGKQTNNWAEYEAIIIGLTRIKHMYGAKLQNMHVELRMDSELVQRQLSGVYKVKDAGLREQYMKIHNILAGDMPHVSFVHVRRELNKEADRLANEAMDNG